MEVVPTRSTGDGWRVTYRDTEEAAMSLLRKVEAAGGVGHASGQHGADGWRVEYLTRADVLIRAARQ